MSTFRLRRAPLVVRRQSRRGRAATLATGLLMMWSGLAAVTLAAQPPSYAGGPSLSVSPARYVGGQRLIWSGTVGHPGARSLVLQFNMGRPGDQWTTVDGFHSHTRPDGSFRFAFPAPSMFNIRYRVKAGPYVSASKLFTALTQDLTIRVTGHDEDNTNAPEVVTPGQTYGISVDTTPAIFRSPMSQDLPVFTGRHLTLQRRIDGDTWRTLATTTVDSRGSGAFSGLEASPGVTVYRVVEGDYFMHGDRIGWTQSFPLYVLSGDDAQRRYAAARAMPDSQHHAAAPALERRGSPAPTATASQRYGWYPSLWDFAWEYGESLSSPAARGTHRGGSWLDYSDGAGRVSKSNGALALDSKRYTGAGPGDFGTLRATLQHEATSQGRWEARMRIRSAFERNSRDYRILAELVPASPAAYDCGSHNIEIASISPFSNRVQFGVRSPQANWTGTATASATPMHSSYAVAVEVAKNHLTWFLNGSPVGTVTDPKALSGIPMTLRFSLEGDGQKEMNQVSLVSDWQRGFPLGTGHTVISHHRLARHSDSSGCHG